MDAIQREHEKLSQLIRHPKPLDEARNMLSLLENAKQNIENNPGSTSLTLATLQSPIKSSFDSSLAALKETYSAMNKYSKAMDKFFKDKPLPGPEYDAISHQPELIRGAILTHLLREGEFEVADTFLAEHAEHTEHPETKTATAGPQGEEAPAQPEPSAQPSQTIQTGLPDAVGSFRRMYDILAELRQNGNPQPVIAWAAENHEQLEERGSDLEFQLFRWQFIWTFHGGGAQGPMSSSDGVPTMETRQRAVEFARQHAANFRKRHYLEIRQLVCAMAFHVNLEKSPYAHIFSADDAWAQVITSFSREFCFSLGIPEASPLRLAVTAGCVALPSLMKMHSLMTQTRANWTTQQELPAEVPLPSALHFHSIFVCPVSKEQATHANPPMLLPCGHVLARESMDNIARMSFIKCPYCPAETHVSHAKTVIL